MLHKNIPANERHAPWSWEFADAAARLLAVDFVEQDVGKVALDKDTKQAWILASTAPTWVPMGSGGGGDGGVPGPHSHPIGDVVGLQAALAATVNLAQAHAVALYF